MPRFSSVILAAMIGAATSTAQAETGSARAAMGQCVDRVLSGLARDKVPETQAGRAVLSQCDRQLRDTLQEAIRRGEAPFCTVDGCMGIARARAAGEATDAYRKLLRRA